MAESTSTHESHGLSRSFPIILWALAYKQLSRHDIYVSCWIKNGKLSSKIASSFLGVHETFHCWFVRRIAVILFSGEEKCIDRDPRCRAWARWKFCTSERYKHVMLQACRRSCAFCVASKTSAFHRIPQILQNTSHSVASTVFHCSTNQVLRCWKVNRIRYVIRHNEGS